MSDKRILAKREITTYAEILLDAAKVSGTVFEVAGQLQEVQTVILTHPRLRESLDDSMLPAQVRADIATEVLKGFDVALVKVIAVMAERGDMDLLHRVVSEFGELAEGALDAVIIDVTTVVELDDALRATIKNKFAAQLGKDIMLREHLDSSIIGGIVLGAHGNVIDASVASQLEKTRAVLSSITTGGER